MDTNEKYKAYKKLTGSSSAMTALLVFAGFCILFGFALIALLVLMGTKRDMLEILIMVILGAFYVGLLIVFITLIKRRTIHKRELKEKFRKLSDQEKTYVDKLAYDYRTDYLKNDEKYLYGNMSYITPNSFIKRGVMSFEYISMGDLAWVYMINGNITPKMEAAIAGATAAIVVGAMYDENLVKYRSIFRQANFNPVQPRINRAVHIILRDGTSYKGKIAVNDFDALKESLSVYSPSCRFGLNPDELENN